jgi:hypothetical protein
MRSAGGRKMQQLKANEHVYQLATGHWAPRCLQLIAEVGVADHLGDEPRRVEELAEATNVNADAIGDRYLIDLGAKDYLHSLMLRTSELYQRLGGIGECGVCCWQRS